VEFEDGFGLHFVHGRHVENELFRNVQTIEGAAAEFKKQDNEEIKSLIITIVRENHGSQGVMDMLGAELVDEQVIEHKNGYKEKQRLFRTKETFPFAMDSKGGENAKLAWNEMICPSTGRPYLIETCPLFSSVVDSAKWLRGEVVPTDIPYQWASAN
jgi:hypothetical protein